MLNTTMCTTGPMVPHASVVTIGQAQRTVFQESVVPRTCHFRRRGLNRSRER